MNYAPRKPKVQPTIPDITMQELDLALLSAGDIPLHIASRLYRELKKVFDQVQQS